MEDQNTGAHSTKGTSEPSAARSGTPPKKVRAAKRLKWSNEMVADLVRLRFADGDVKRRLEAAIASSNVVVGKVETPVGGRLQQRLSNVAAARDAVQAPSSTTMTATASGSI
eukprot:jgi/Phyca11/99762/e_gw1.4.1238.1